MTSQHVHVDGIRMWWEEQGEGRPVVFIHGIPTSPALWRHVVPMVHGARCLAWEMVGYGASLEEGKGRDISVARQADYLARWMDEIELESALLVGHDLGGGVAQIAAVRHPQRVRGLVLMNAICYDSWPIPSVKILRALSPVVARLPDAFLYLIFGLLFYRGHDSVDRAREALQVHGPPYKQGGGAAAFVRQIQALDVEDTLAVADALSRLDVPARLVWGASDRFQKIEYGERLARDLQAPLERIEGGKHFVPEDQPGRVAAAVNALLEQVSPAM